MIHTVIFDMDGLMFDTERLSTEAWISIGKKHGFAITEELLSCMRGRPLADCICIFEKSFGESFDYWLLRKEKMAYFDSYIEENGIPVKEGLVTLLSYLRDNQIPAAVATSTGRKIAEGFLKKAGVYDYFSAFVYGDEVSKGKPDPESFLRAMNKLGFSPKESLVLEDSYVGVEAAIKSGAAVIMIPDMMPPTKKETDHVLACLSNLAEVILYLK